MEYILQPGNKKFGLNYKELRELYFEYSNLSDDNFIKELPNILHFACIASYLKELSREETVSDVGIIHQLVHLINNPDEPIISLIQIRTQFEELLKLS